ncbi:MAG: EamA family transporter, partial [Planctomycetota bacterium]
MIFLLANIVFGSLFGLCLKWVENRDREDIVNVGMINYIVAALICYWEFRHLDSEHVTLSGIGTGATMGVAYFVAFFFCIYAIKFIGVANSTVVSILSMCVPIVVGVLKWGEDPNAYQWIGIGLSLVALSLIGKKGDAIKQGTVPDKPWFTPWIVVGFFILCGMSRLAQEAFKHMCDEVVRPVYLMSAFSIAAIPSIFVLIYRQKRISLNEFLIGSALGATN